MVSATLNQDLKELANLALKKPLQFSVDRQQRKADIKNLKLTQYVVRLQFDGLAPERKGQTIFDQVNQAQKKKQKHKSKKKLDPDHPDFDSEEEYDNEVKEYVSSDEDDEEAEEESEEINPNSGFTVKKVAPNEYLIKREATLISILKKSFKQRVIIFCNEKLQCTRLLILLTIFGFKAEECHGNMD